MSFVKVSPEIVNVSLGQNVTLDCMAKGYPTPTITWSGVGELPGSSRVESNGTVSLLRTSQDLTWVNTCVLPAVIWERGHALSHWNWVRYAIQCLNR